MKKFIISLIAFLIAITVFGQDSLHTEGAVLPNVSTEGALPQTPTMLWIQFLAGVALFAYEYFARVFATTRSYSILTFLAQILNAVMPDRMANTEGEHIGAHQITNFAALTTEKIDVGDTVILADNSQLKVIGKTAKLVVTESRNIPIEDVIEVIKQGNAIYNLVKSLVSLISKFFKKG